MPVTDFLQNFQNRRTLLRRGVKGLALAAGAGLTGRLANAALTATPTETEGPFWQDVQLNRTDIRGNTATATNAPSVIMAGMPLRLTVNLSKLANGVSTPVQGAYIDLWHCNYGGHYSDETGSSVSLNGADTGGQNFLRGYQITDAHGIVRFITNYPTWYNGRTSHIHARVRIYSGTTATTNFTTQFFFDDTVTTAVHNSSVVYTGTGVIGTGTSAATYTSATSKTYAQIYSSTYTRTYNTADMVYTTVTSSVGSTTANPDGSKLLTRLSDNGTYCIGSYNIVLT